MNSSILCITGSRKHVGKTTLACAIVKYFRHKSICALKIAAHSDETLFSHHPEVDRRKGFLLIEENSASLSVDSRRMLASGAECAYFLACRTQEVNERVGELISAHSNKLWVIESNTFALANPCVPYVLLFDKEQSVKQSAQILTERAPVVFGSLTEALADFKEHIHISNNQWILAQ